MERYSSMQADGLWTVIFSRTEEVLKFTQLTEQQNRGGTLILTDGRVYGGGISYYFIGAYDFVAGRIHMNIQAKRYNDLVSSPFEDMNEARFVLSGTINGNQMRLHGHFDDDTNKRLYIEANRQVILD